MACAAELRDERPWLRRSKLTIAHAFAELREDRASLEEQVVAVLAEAVHQDDGERGVGRSVLLVVQLHAVTRADEARALRFGCGELVDRGVAPGSAHAPVGDDAGADCGYACGSGTGPDAAAFHAVPPRYVRGTRGPMRVTIS